MNFCVAPREIREINKRGGGGQNKLRGVSKSHEKINVPPPFILNLRVKVKILPIPEFSRTATKIQGLSRALNFLKQIPELSMIFKDSGNLV